MIIVDRALADRAAAGQPVRVGMVGAGFMAHGITNQVLNSTPGMELVAIANRHPDRARDAYAQAGATEVASVSNADELDRAIASGRPAITDDPTAITRSDRVDAIIEVTGSMEYAAHAVVDAIEHGTHVIMMNAELDGTVGPWLKVLADRAGVIYSACDGDQPGVQMNLYRFVTQLGLTPILSGNIKGLQDEYRNPTTQQGFADRWGQNVHMVTSFADGTKMSFEQALVANATGMTVSQRGMQGLDFDGHVDEATELFGTADELAAQGGIVDYLVGARPGPGVFLYATHHDPKQRHYLELYKLGPGPVYSFYTPYHLCHFEVPISVARAVLFADPVMQPAGAPRVEVVAVAKTDLVAGTVLDRYGGYHTYGQAEKSELVGGLLPMGLAEGCRLRHDVPGDHVLTLEDVEVPSGRLVDRLLEQQRDHFAAVHTA